GDTVNGPVDPTTTPEPTLADLIARDQAINTTDLSLTKSDTMDPVIAGETLTYTFAVSNAGPNPAFDLQVLDSLPAGTTFQSATAPCAGQGDSLTCDLAPLYSTTQSAFAVTVLVAADLVHNAGAPTTLVNQASVQHRGPDISPADNSAS